MRKQRDCPNDSLGKQKPTDLTKRQPEEGRKSNHQDGGAEGEQELGNWRRASGDDGQNRGSNGQHDELNSRWAKHIGRGRDRENNIEVLGGSLTARHELDDVVSIPSGGSFRQRNQQAGRPAVAVLLFKSRWLNVSVRLSVVMGEHDFQVLPGSHKAHGMVVIQPCTGDQKGREQSRVVRCKSKQQD